MPLAVCPGRNTGIELENGDLTGVLDHCDQAAKTDVTNVVYIDYPCAVMTTRRVRGVPPEFPYIAARVIKSTTGAGFSGASG